MRKVNGENITIKELKESYFGYNDYADLDKIVELIECNGWRYVYSEDGDAFICYPIYIDDSDIFACYSRLNEKEIGNITVYDFIHNWWRLDDFNLEDFTFYFTK